jgi:hypothetical protein
MCVQKEERIKESHDDSINHVKHNKTKNFFNSPEYKKGYSHDSKTPSFKGKTSMNEQDQVHNGVCRHCKKDGHYMRDCIEFLK